MPPKGPQAPQGPQPQAEHPKANKIVEALEKMLGRKQDTAETPISEGAAVLDNSAEHQAVADQLVKQRATQDAAEVEEARLREQALSELGGSSGVVTGGPEAIEQKMAEIKARNASESGPSTPAA